MDSKAKSQIWVHRIVKMIIFFAVMGMLVLGAGAYLMSNTLNSILKEVNPPPPAATPR